jgi:hypothetical protein
MSYNYLIKIDKDLVSEQEEILKYIYKSIENDRLEKIQDIKCIRLSDLIYDVRKKINMLGETRRNKKISHERCKICDNKYELNQFIFKFSACNHEYHKKCIKMVFKKDKKTICACCNDKFLEKIINSLFFEEKNPHCGASKLALPLFEEKKHDSRISNKKSKPS